VSLLPLPFLIVRLRAELARWKQVAEVRDRQLQAKDEEVERVNSENIDLRRQLMISETSLEHFREKAQVRSIYPLALFIAVLCSVQFSSVQFSSIQFYSVQFSSILFCSVSIPLLFSSPPFTSVFLYNSFFFLTTFLLFSVFGRRNYSGRS